MRIDPQQVIAHIEALKLEYPELADDEQLRADVFEGQTDLHSVLAALVAQTLDAASMVAAIKIRKMELAERQSRYERAEDARRELIAKLLQHANLRKLVLPDATLSLKYVPPGPMVSDEEALPNDCVIWTRKPNLQFIKRRIAEGDTPPGVTMKNGYETLMVRTK